MKKNISSIIPGVIVMDPMNEKLYCITYNCNEDFYYYLFDLQTFTLYNDYRRKFRFKAKELIDLFRFHHWELIEKDLHFQLSELRQFEIVEILKP